MFAPLPATGRTPAAYPPAFPAGPDGLILSTPAKLNFFLEVHGKRPDGYHDLETLMVAVNLFDTLELRPASGGVLELTCDTPGLPTGPDNLVYQAADRLRQHANRPDLGATVRLTKRIPAQAGLAGGSSDAAAAIIGLNQVWNLNLPSADLVAVAAEVGSDVAFFLNLPAAWCTGRGEITMPEPAPQAFDAVLVCPPVGLATADVFRRLRVPTNSIRGDAARAAFRAGDPEALGAALFNRLQEPAFGLVPQVETVYRRLADLNPAGCLMSGSGSAVFALARNPRDAARIASEFLAARPPAEPPSRVLVVRTIHIVPA